MFRHARPSLAALAALALSAAPAAAQLIIVDTRVLPYNPSALTPFASDPAQVAPQLVGQTVTTPAGAGRIATFSFFVGYVNPFRDDYLDFTVRVQRFDPVGGVPVGPVLFESALMTVVLGDGFVQREANLSVPVVGGATYLFSVNATGPSDAYAGIAVGPGDRYAGGGTYRVTNGVAEFSDDDLDLVVGFARATVPEPATVTLLAGGLLAVAGLARRRVRTA